MYFKQMGDNDRTEAIYSILERISGSLDNIFAVVTNNQNSESSSHASTQRGGGQSSAAAENFARSLEKSSNDLGNLSNVVSEAVAQLNKFTKELSEFKGGNRGGGSNSGSGEAVTQASYGSSSDGGDMSGTSSSLSKFGVEIDKLTSSTSLLASEQNSLREQIIKTREALKGLGATGTGGGASRTTQSAQQRTPTAPQMQQQNPSNVANTPYGEGTSAQKAIEFNEGDDLINRQSGGGGGSSGYGGTGVSLGNGGVHTSGGFFKAALKFGESLGNLVGTIAGGGAGAAGKGAMAAGGAGGAGGGLMGGGAMPGGGGGANSLMGGGGMPGGGGGGGGAGAGAGDFAEGLSSATQAVQAFTDVLVDGVKMIVAAIASSNKYITAGTEAEMQIEQAEMRRDKETLRNEGQRQIAKTQRDTDKRVKEIEIENQIKLKKAETESQLLIKQAENEAQKRINQADLIASTYEQKKAAHTGLLKDGINETAWNALRSKIELGAKEQTYAVESRRMDMEYSSLAKAKRTEYSSFVNARNKELAEYNTLQNTKYSNQIAKLQAEQALINKDFEVDAWKAAAHGRTKQNFDMEGKTADWFIGDVLNARDESIDKLREDEKKINDFYGVESHSVFNRDIVRGTGGEGEDMSKGFINEYGEDLTNPGLLDNIANAMGTGGEDMVHLAIDKYALRQKFQTEMDKIATETSSSISDIVANGEYQAAMSNINTQNQINSIVANTANSIENANIRSITEIEKRQIEAIKNVELQYLEMAKELESVLSKWEGKANDFGISRGYMNEAQLRKYEKQMIRDVATQTYKYGVDMEKYMELRSGYQNATNRNAELNDSDIQNLSAMYKVFGGDSEMVTSYAGAMEIFNHGITESADTVSMEMKAVNKMGLNGRQYVKEMTKNLKLAQKYNFKEGTEGLKRMTQWAMKTRFNMDSLGGIIDKVIEGGLEGVIEQSSSLQVLGGNAAIYSDPFGMMFDAGADAEAYGERILNMTKGIGSINQKTGETEFNLNEEYYLRSMAKSLGMDVGELKDLRRAANRRDAVSLALSDEQKARFDQDQIDYMGNVAHYDKKSGGFVVNAWDEETGSYKPKSINDLTPEDLEALQPVEYQDKMVDYAGKILSCVEGLNAQEIWQKANIGVTLYNDLMAEMAEKARVAHDYYIKHYTEYVTEIKDMWWRSAKDMKSMLEGNGPNDQETMQGMIRTLIAEGNNFTAALKQIAESLKASFENFHGEEYSIDTPGSQSASQTQYGFFGTGVRNFGAEDGSTIANIADEADRFFEHPVDTMADWLGIRDGYISGNGQPMYGRASSVTPINDGYVTDPADEGLIGKPGGWVDKLVNGMYSMIKDMHNGNNQGSSNSNMSLNISGSLTIESNGQSIDIISAMRNDPMITRELTSLVLRQAQINNLGGKANNPLNNGDRNTISF